MAGLPESPEMVDDFILLSGRENSSQKRDDEGETKPNKEVASRKKFS
tara:strand:+ start:312 stop:452 length:141 start_codon:yes stop_codon:yes gene_type:complete